jgi:hypothetical protein
MAGFSLHTAGAVDITFTVDVAWNKQPNKAISIASHSSGTIWAVSLDHWNDYGFYVNQWNGKDFVRLTNTVPARRIAVTSTGLLWTVDDLHNLSAQQQPSGVAANLGKARDVAVGGDDSVWIIGDDSRTGGFGVYQRTSTGWNDVGGAAVRIAVDKAGMPWVVNEDGNIYRFNTVSRVWEQKSGAATAIFAGPVSGSVWMLGRDSVGGGFPIYQWNSGSNRWDAYGNLGAVEMAEAAGTPWMVQSDGSIYAKSPPLVIGPIQVTVVTALPTPIPQLLQVNSSGTGKMLCSKTDFSSCGDTKADYVGKYTLDLTCDNGFYDPIWGGSCWKCPDDTDNKGSWIRSADSIERDTACWRVPKETLGKATKVKSPSWAWECPSGSFWDIYSPDGLGGSCWTCPPDLPRRTGYAVYSDSACATSLNETRAAILLSFNGCPKPNAANMSLAGKRTPGRPFLDIAAGWSQGVASGGCYACPIVDETGNFLITERNGNPIYDKDGNQGCSINYKWQPAPFVEPGLAYMQGVKDLIWEQKLLDGNRILGLLYDLAETRGLGNATPEAKAWVIARLQEFAKKPYNSEVLRTLMFARIKAAVAKNPFDRTPAELRLLQSYASYIQARRTYIAQQGLDMYKAWKTWDETYRAQTGQTKSLGQYFYYGTVPLDFQGTVGSLMGLTGAGAALAGSLVSANAFAEGVGVGLAEPGAREDSLFQLMNGLKILKSAHGLSVVAGATIIEAAFAVLTSIAVDQFVAIESAQSRLESALAGAKQAVDLTTLAKSDNGEDLLYFYWAQAMETTDAEDSQVVDQASQVYARAMQADYAAPPKTLTAPTIAPYTGDRISSGTTAGYLTEGQRLVAANGKYYAEMQTDGNFVIYDQNGTPIWATGTNGRGSHPYKLAMQADSNLVVYGGTAPLWASGPRSGTAPYTLVMQNDANLVIYDTSHAIWASNTQR